MLEKDVSKKEILSVSEAATEMGYSRQHVLRLINAGKIKATRVGRSYIIPRGAIGGVYQELTSADKKAVDQAVAKVFSEYGEVIRKLSKE